MAMARSATVCLCALLVAPLAWAGDWPQYRGPNYDFVAIETDQEVPTNWSWDGDSEEGENIAWSVALPGRGLATPIVVGDQVVVSCSSGPEQDRLHVISFDTATGDVRWERQFWATGRTMTHPKTSVAAPTPASDGRHIVVLYSSNDCVCLDLDGNLQWARGLTLDYRNASNSLGMASSPLIVDGYAIVQVENDAESFTAALDVATGTNVWKLSRPEAANWTSPTVYQNAEGKHLLLVQSTEGLSAIEPATGATVWEYEQGASTIPSTTTLDGRVFVPSDGLTALAPPESGASPEVLWQSSRLAPSTPTPIAVGGKVYSINRSGAVACADASSGDRLWQVRLEGPFSGTPAIVGDKMVGFNEKGQGQVVDLSGDEAKVIGGGDLGDTILCNTAIANGAIYVRSDARLWKISR